MVSSESDEWTGDDDGALHPLSAELRGYSGGIIPDL